MSPYISAVPPEVTLVPTEKGTAVCKAAAGKPAAQISWTPEGDCVTEQEPSWDSGTVTVQSTCRWGGRHVLNVSCSVINKTCCVWEAWISFSFPSVEPCLDSEHQQEMSPEKLLPSRPSLCLSKPPVSPSPSYSKSFEVDSGLCQGIFLTAFLIITDRKSVV